MMELESVIICRASVVLNIDSCHTRLGQFADKQYRTIWCFNITDARRNINSVFTGATVCIARSLPSFGVCPSVSPSHAGITSKRINPSLNVSDLLVATSF